jgi:hypothetical protein
MGIFTVFLTNSAHIAPIPGKNYYFGLPRYILTAAIGGFLGQFVSYR